jgi:hypothetical protein
MTSTGPALLRRTRPGPGWQTEVTSWHRSQLARWTGVAVVSTNAISQIFVIRAYLWWSLVIIAADVVALYALCVYGSRAHADAVWNDADWGAGQS